MPSHKLFKPAYLEMIRSAVHVGHAVADRRYCDAARAAWCPCASITPVFKTAIILLNAIIS
jgi:hypothetical protein